MSRSTTTSALIAFALLAAPQLARADRRPTSFLVTSPLNTPAPCRLRSSREDAHRGTSDAMIAVGGIVFSVSYGLAATYGAISANPPTESSWVREDGWWLVPGAGGFIAGIHRRALGDLDGGYSRMAIGAAFGVLQSTGVYLMVEGIRRFGRPRAGSRSTVAMPFVTIDSLSNGATFGFAGSF